MEKVCRCHRLGQGQGQREPPCTGCACDTLVISQDHMEGGDVISRILHVEGHRQKNLRSSEIKYLIWSFSSQPNHSLKWFSGKFVTYYNLVSATLWGMKAQVIVRDGQERAAQGANQREKWLAATWGMQLLFGCSTWGRVKGKGVTLPTWWGKEEGLRKMRTWGCLDSTLKQTVVKVGIPAMV